VAGNTAARWARTFVDTVRRDSRRTAFDANRRCLLESLDALTMGCRRAERRFFLLDYDGTLRPFTSRPEEAVPSPRLLALLRALAGSRRTEAFLVSGRPAATLETWFRDVPIGLCAEHGHLLRLPGREQWETLTAADTEWKGAVLPILESFAAMTPGALVERKAIALAWHWRGCDPEFGLRQAKELAAHLDEALAHCPIEVILGHKVVEVRARGVSKAALADYLARRWTPQDFVLALGDDRTDEDLFARLPAWAWSCRVGRGPTQAASFVETQSDALRLLVRLAQVVRRAATREQEQTR
jgi:trehalose 6-phosphate synthase/phosphatase